MNKHHTLYSHRRISGVRRLIISHFVAKPCGLNVVPCGAPELYGGILCGEAMWTECCSLWCT